MHDYSHNVVLHAAYISAGNRCWSAPRQLAALQYQLQHYDQYHHRQLQYPRPPSHYHHRNLQQETNCLQRSLNYPHRDLRLPLNPHHRLPSIDSQDLQIMKSLSISSNTAISSSDTSQFSVKNFISLPNPDTYTSEGTEIASGASLFPKSATLASFKSAAVSDDPEKTKKSMDVPSISFQRVRPVRRNSMNYKVISGTDIYVQKYISVQPSAIDLELMELRRKTDSINSNMDPIPTGNIESIANLGIATNNRYYKPIAADDKDSFLGTPQVELSSLRVCTSPVPLRSTSPLQYGPPIEG